MNIRHTLRALAMATALAAAVGGAHAQPAEQPSSMTTRGSSITPEMRTNFDARMRAAEAIIAAIEKGPDAATLTVANIVWLRESLYRLTLEQLQRMGAPSTLADASDALGRIRDATPQLGSSSVELVYYPITPCRYIDTRIQGGPLAGSRTIDLAFTGGAFGGSIACDPKAAVGGNEDNIGALAINVAIVGPTVSPGFLGVRPAGATNTSALVNWWQQGASVQASNAGIVTTNQSTASAAEIEFFGSATHFIVDIFGVFAAPTATAMDCVAGGLATATANTTTRNYAVTSGACPTGYAPVSVNCSVSGGDFGAGRMRKSEAGINNPGAASTCSGYYSGATSVTVTAQARCCRVPGR